MSGRYIGYSGYTNGGVEWAAALPETWGQASLRWVAKIYAGGTPSKANRSFWEGGSIPWLNSGSVNQATITQASGFITPLALQNSSARWIKRGSLVVALAGQGKTKGMVAQLGIDATCNQSMAAIVPSRQLMPRYLLWWLTSNYQNLRNLAGGDLRDGLNLRLLGDIQCPLPAAEEQTQIANFLDYETAKIDALIAKQQQLIALLKEKRQAVITHTVTKGLNPDAPMRDSGVEWLGVVPAHWEVKRVKHVCLLESGHTPRRTEPSYWVEDECTVPWVSLNDTRTLDAEDYIAETEVLISPKGMANSSAHLIPSGAVVFNRDGARVGLAAITADEMCVSQHIIAWVCGPEVLNEYLLHVVYAMRPEIYRVTWGSTIPTIGMTDVRQMVCPVPPMPEQRAISDMLFNARERLGRAETSAQESIQLLLERRTALISAAVTGKIDVRGWTPPESATKQDVA